MDSQNILKKNLEKSTGSVSTDNIGNMPVIKMGGVTDFYQVRFKLFVISQKNP